MIAELYIIPESFQHNSITSIDEIESKVQALGNDFVEIRKYKETNKLFIHSDIYNVKFINNITLSDILFNPGIGKQNLDRDTLSMLMKIVVDTETTDITSQEVKEILLKEHNQDLCHGVIGFNEIEDIDINAQIIYNLQGWLNFRRYYLGLYPKNEIFFISECEKYFPNLFFHPRNVTTIGFILGDCSSKIVYHLAALNDKFEEAKQVGLNRTQVLEDFSRIAKLDETASLEGNTNRKLDFTFDFKDSQGCSINICCEPHLKLCYNDNYPGDSSYSNNRRIYFHEGTTEVAEGRILIGHIGKHL